MRLESFRATLEEVLQDQQVSLAHGLSRSEATRRLREHGPNRLRESRGRSVWHILLNQVASVVIGLLIAAAAAAAAFGAWLEATAILAALLVNTLVGFVMELRASRAMQALQRLGRVTARVRRDRTERLVPAERLVPGDVVLLEAGDIISADLRLVEANRLRCDESALTGESVPVDKGIEALAEKDVPLGERVNMAHKGTAVTQGSGVGIVIATGMGTELGRISSLVETAEQARTPLEKRLDALGRRLIWLTLGIALVVAAAGLLAGKDPYLMLETAVALAIAAVPEGLPVVATLALAEGMRRMARRNAVVKQLSSVEALGAATIIFTDKTGTLTENRLSLDRLVLSSGSVMRTTVNGADTFVQDGEELSPDRQALLVRALEVAALCNNASLEDEGAVGDPSEIALLRAAAAEGIDRKSLLERLPEAREEGFDPAVKMMATYHRNADGHGASANQDNVSRCRQDRFPHPGLLPGGGGESERAARDFHGKGLRVAVKGAPEAVLDVCTRVLTPTGETPLEDKGRADWQARSDGLAGDGLRVLALAEKRADGSSENPYDRLTLIGLAGLRDPPRPGVAEAVAACQAAGIRVVLGTGDHAATARAIAAEVGLAEADTVVIPAGDVKAPDALDADFRDRLLHAPVYARISPEQKLHLIDLYQRAGMVVAMTGDGVNDAPALKKADIGIAMGRRGTQVAREAADIVLKDDAFATIVTAVEQGRTIFRNIRRFIIYLLSGNLGEILAVSAAALVNAPLPLLPLQILYINFVCDVLPALALGLSRSEADVLKQRPRDAREPILLARHWYAIGGYGTLIAAAVLGAFAYALGSLGLDHARAVSLSFLAFGFARLWHVFNMRSPRSPLLLNEVTRNGFVWLALGAGVLLLLAAAYAPLLRQVLEVDAPEADGWLLLLGFSLLPLVIAQGMKRKGLLWEQGREPKRVAGRG